MVRFKAGVKVGVKVGGQSRGRVGVMVRVKVRLPLYNFRSLVEGLLLDVAG